MRAPVVVVVIIVAAAKLSPRQRCFCCFAMNLKFLRANVLCASMCGCVCVCVLRPQLNGHTHTHTYTHNNLSLTHTRTHTCAREIAMPLRQCGQWDAAHTNVVMKTKKLIKQRTKTNSQLTTDGNAALRCAEPSCSTLRCVAAFANLQF